MLPAITSASSALQAEQLRAAAAAHDIANANTPTHKVREVSLEGSESSGVKARDEGARHQQGHLLETGQPLDLAIYGNGFFQVRTSDGQLALTRTGKFRTDSTGQIVTAGGVSLIPPITIPPLGMQLTVSSDGVVSAGGIVYGRIQLVEVPAPERLEPIGDGLYRPTVASGGPTPSTSSRIQQGALEQSTTDVAAAGVDLMTAKHSFAANVRSLEAQDELVRALMSM
jgi:flagellar basal-body rod protein FlgG